MQLELLKYFIWYKLMLDLYKQKGVLKPDLIKGTIKLYNNWITCTNNSRAIDSNANDVNVKEGEASPVPTTDDVVPV